MAVFGFLISDCCGEVLMRGPLLSEIVAWVQDPGCWCLEEKARV
jgi:hypothetical protein